MRVRVSEYLLIYIHHAKHIYKTATIFIVHGITEMSVIRSFFIRILSQFWRNKKRINLNNNLFNNLLFCAPKKLLYSATFIFKFFFKKKMPDKMNSIYFTIHQKIVEYHHHQIKTPSTHCVYQKKSNCDFSFLSAFVILFFSVVQTTRRISRL